MVNNLIALLNCLGIQVFRLIVICLVYVWIRICFSVFICQLIVVIHQLVTSDVKFLFVNDEFLWLELRLCWWGYNVVKLCVSSWIGHRCFQSVVCILRNSHRNLSNHVIVSDTEFFVSWNFLRHRVLDDFTNLSIFHFWELFKGNNTMFIIGSSSNNNSVFILHFKCELILFKGTTHQGFFEVYSDWDCRNDIVVEDSVIGICCFTT